MKSSRLDPTPKTARGLRRLATEVDSQPSLLTAAQRLRRRLPGDERFGDPISTAGPQPVTMMARRVSALQPERNSVLQELALGALQVSQSLSESTGRGHGDRQMAVLFTDLVGFSSWALQAGEGVMATFLSAADGVEAALQARAAVGELDMEGYHPRLRAGLHWGSPRRLVGDYVGVDVNVAARVADAAKGDQVLVSDVLLSQLDDAVLAELNSGRARRLKADGAPPDLRVLSISRP